MVERKVVPLRCPICGKSLQVETCKSWDLPYEYLIDLKVENILTNDDLSKRTAHRVDCTKGHCYGWFSPILKKVTFLFFE